MPRSPSASSTADSPLLPSVSPFVSSQQQHYSIEVPYGTPRSFKSDDEPPLPPKSPAPPLPIPAWAQRMSTTANHRWRFRRGFPIRRYVLLFIFLLTASLAIVTLIRDGSMPAAEERTSKSYMDAMVGAPYRLKDAMQGFVGWDSGPQDEYYEGLDPSLVLNYPEPQETLQKQLKSDVRYITALCYGGHANQFISTGKLLYLARLTRRVAIIPTLLPIHFQAPPANFSEFFDLPRFYALSHIPAIEFSTVKAVGLPNTPQNEGLSCWSIQEATVGQANLQAHSLDIHNIWMDVWPLPPLARGLGGFDLAFEALKMFDFDNWWRGDWINQVRRDYLPQKSEAELEKVGGDRSRNMKNGFDPLNTPPPGDQLLCFDNTLFIGPVMFPEAFPGEIPLEANVPGEGMSWIGATQYIHFNPVIESHVDDYLMALFEVASPSKIPPFISVHLRRGDFKEFAGLTALDKYERAVQRVRERLQVRIDGEVSWRGPGRQHFRTFGKPASEYAVLTTTDEPTGSPFIDEVRALGWKVLDHGALDTATKLGGWYPTILDAAILARGQSFVGTDRSTFSHLAGLRVKYWHGGLVDTAV